MCQVWEGKYSIYYLTILSTVLRKYKYHCVFRMLASKGSISIGSGDMCLVWKSRPLAVSSEETSLLLKGSSVNT